MGVPRARARSKTTVATNSSLSIEGALVIPYLVATSSRNSWNWDAGTVRESLRSWLSIWTTASLRNVAGPLTNSTGWVSASSSQGPGSGFAPFGILPEMQPSSRSSRKMLRPRISFGSSPLTRTTTGSSPNSPRTRWGAWSGALRESTRGPTPAAVSTWGAATAAATATSAATTSTARAWRTDQAARAPSARPTATSEHPRPGRQSIESGPEISAWRNWLTNGLEESKTSSFGPDSTILPLQRTAMKSAIRRAVLRSWEITR